MPFISASQTFTLLWLVTMATASQDGGVLRAASNHDVPVVVTVNIQKSLNTITDHFIGHSLGDPTAVQLSRHFDSKKLQNLARALAPLYVRFGGEGGTFHVASSQHSLQLWEKMNNFFKLVGWDSYYILDPVSRNHDGSWDTSYTRQLLKASADRNYHIAGFELGNEYDLYSSSRPITLSPEQLVHDVAELQKLLNGYPLYSSSFIVGPDTAFVNPKYFHGFLAAGGNKYVRAATFHQYYFDGHHPQKSYFTDVNKMDSLARMIDNAFNQTRSVDRHLPVWLGETGSASVGGVAGMTDRFMSGFLWLDKLGVCAAKGIGAVIRHVFYGDHDHYGIIDTNLDPNTDYWLTILYKRIVRGAVFHASGRHDVRVYAACANRDNFKAGGLAVYMLNPNNYPVTFDLPQFSNQPRFRYSLTAGDNDGLTSKHMALNGVKLQLVNDNLPPLKPESAPRGMVTVPAYSYTFLVFPEAGVSICLH
ncbi:heparanase-like [Littorina saxatilis]|uniref:Glycoside hydrolase family 79 n=1 Tax=Littorina saxatilis TaxID=31220 RepID=A0AAN9AUN3_9CAEN